MKALSFSDEQVGHHMTQYLERAWGLRQEAEHVMHVCQLFVQCKEVRFVYGLNGSWALVASTSSPSS